jgi:hypothetical protein
MLEWIKSEVRPVERECHARHERTNSALAVVRNDVEENTVWRIEFAGRSGKNGELRRITKRVEEVEKEQKNQRQLIIRLVLAMLAASMTGAGAAHAIMSALAKGAT